MTNLGKHAARRRRVRQLRDPPDAIELQSNQRRALAVMASNGAADLLDRNRLYGLRTSFCGIHQ
jgi:hypothetical protein